MDQQPYTSPSPDQQTTPATATPQKKSHTGLIVLIILILIVLAFALFGKNRTEETNDTAVPATEQTDDISSLEAELEATNVDGVSEGL